MKAEMKDEKSGGAQTVKLPCYTVVQFDVRFQHLLLDPEPMRTPGELASEIVKRGFVELLTTPQASQGSLVPSLTKRSVVLFAKDILFMIREDDQLVTFQPGDALDQRLRSNADA